MASSSASAELFANSEVEATPAPGMVGADGTAWAREVLLPPSEVA